MDKLKRPVVWVTGASKGIGAAISVAFAAIGAHVVAAGRNRKALARVCASIRKNGGEADVKICDVTSEASVSKTHASIVRTIGAVDVLVNNAGVTYFVPFEKTTARQLDHVLETNLRGVFLCTKAVVRRMARKKSGHIFNIISVAATKTFYDSSAYASSKAGVVALMNGLRAEVRNKGVKIINVLPGAVETEMWSKQERKKYGKKMMQPEDIADVVVSLYCQPSRVVTEEIVIRPVEGDL
jgi:NADP-dependent 3-hydroxy acid dehydrogenase YdfG